MDRLAALKAKLKAREGKPGFEKNCDELRSEIERIEKGLALAAFVEANREKSS